MIKLVHWARKHSFQKRTWRRWATPFWGTCYRLYYYFLNNLKQVFLFLGACHKETSRFSLPYPLIKKFCRKAIFFSFLKFFVAELYWKCTYYVFIYQSLMTYRLQYRVLRNYLMYCPLDFCNGCSLSIHILFHLSNNFAQ